MAVPSFTDLGKNARDVFKTGYHYGKGLVKLNIRTKSGGTFEMGSDLALTFDTPKLSGWMDAKYKIKDFGTITEKWTSDGTLFMGYDFIGVLRNDITLQSEISYNPESSNKSLKLGAKCANESFNTAFSIVSDMNWNMKLLGSVVTSFKDLFIGYQGGYDSVSNKITKNDVGLAFNYRDVGFHFRCTSIPYEYGLSLLYKVNRDWDAALNGILARSGNNQEWTIGAAAKYEIDTRSTLRFKFNTDLQLGTSLQQKLDNFLTVTLSFNLDCANISKGGHKIGLAFDVEA